MTPSRKKELIERLAKVLRHHRANTPRFTDEKYSNDLAVRFGVNKSTMWTALAMNAKGEYK